MGTFNDPWFTPKGASLFALPGAASPTSGRHARRAGVTDLYRWDVAAGGAADPWCCLVISRLPHEIPTGYLLVMTNSD